MATQTHTSTTHEQFVKKEKDEGIAEKIISLSNEDEDKHDKPEDAQGEATPSSKTEGDELKAELAGAEIENSGDTPALETPAEDSLKHDKVGDAQSPAAPLSKTEEDDKKAEPAVAVEKTDDSVSNAADADNQKEEKELIPDSQTISVTEPIHNEAKCQPDEPPSTEPAVKETPQQLEKEPIETDEQPKTEDIPEASAETTEKSSNTAEANPQTESEAEVVKAAESLETSSQEEKKPEPEPEPEPVTTEVQGKTEESEKESQEKSQEVEQPSTVAIPEPSTEDTEKPSDIIEEKATEETLKETNNGKVEPTETGKTEELVVSTEVEENRKEPEKQPLEQREEEQPNTVAIPEHTAETSDAIEEKTREPEFEATEKAEPVVTNVDENQSEPEKQSFKQEEEEQPKTVIPETAAESAEQAGDKVEVHPPKDSDIEVVKEPENQSFKQEEEEQPNTVIPEMAAESADKPGDAVEVHPPRNSDIEAVKETDNSESEAVPAKEEKPEPLSTEVEEKPREQLQVSEEVGETSREVETKQETDKSEGTSDDTIKDSISFKEEKTDKDEETSITENTTQVSLNEEAQAAPVNLVEPSSDVAEKVVEDGKKESGLTDVIEEVSKKVAGIVENTGQASIEQEAKDGLNEERDTSVEEKVAVAANDDKKEPEAPEAVQGSTREAEVEIKKIEEQNEAKIATTEAERVKVESVQNDAPAVDDKKEGNADTKVNEISTAVSAPVRETLASKFEEKDEESIKTEVDNLEKEHVEEPVKTEAEATKESDASKTSKDLPKETPAKPAQKQSNNIISKVKQSLVKAKKAITGKSPSSKNLTSDAKGDIKVK